MKILRCSVIMACFYLASCSNVADLRVQGVIVDSVTKKPISNATITEGSYAPKLAAGAQTNSSGSFSYLTYPEEHSLCVRKAGYAEYAATIGLSGNEEENLYIELVPQN